MRMELRKNNNNERWKKEVHLLCASLHPDASILRFVISLSSSATLHLARTAAAAV